MSAQRREELHTAIEALRRKTAELLGSLDRRELAPESLAATLDAHRSVLEQMLASKPAPEVLTELERAARELSDLTAIAFDAAERRKQEVGRLLERVHSASRALRYYRGGDTSGASCDLDA